MNKFIIPQILFTADTNAGLPCHDEEMCQNGVNSILTHPHQPQAAPHRPQSGCADNTLSNRHLRPVPAEERQRRAKPYLLVPETLPFSRQNVVFWYPKHGLLQNRPCRYINVYIKTAGAARCRRNEKRRMPHPPDEACAGNEIYL